MNTLGYKLMKIVLISLALVLISSGFVGAEILFYEDFEDELDTVADPYKDWHYSRQGSGSQGLSTEQVRAGSKSYKFHCIGVADPDRVREEISLFNHFDYNDFHFHPGNEYWIGFSVYLGEDFKSYSTQGRRMIHQYHTVPDAPPTCDPKESDVFGKHGFAIFASCDDSYPGKAWVYYDDQQCSDEESVSSNHYNNLPNLDRTGEWTDFVINIKWDYTGEDGFIKIWINGDLEVNHEGANCYNDDHGEYMKIGIYSSYVEEGETATLYYDELRIGDENSNYDEVAPRGATSGDGGGSGVGGVDESDVTVVESGDTNFYDMEAGEIMYFKFDGYVPDSTHPIQVSSVLQYAGEPKTVDMLIRKGRKPTLDDRDLAYTGGNCAHWRYISWAEPPGDGWYPSKPEGAEDLYYCITGGTTEFVEIDKPMEQDTFYIMLYNYGEERVRGQRLIASYGSDSSGSGSSLPECVCGVNMFPGYLDYCEICGPCHNNQGYCKDDTECASGLKCVKRYHFGSCSGYGGGYGICFNEKYVIEGDKYYDPDPTTCVERCPNGHPEHCATCGPCKTGEGLCYANSQCISDYCDLDFNTCQAGPHEECSVDGSGDGDGDDGYIPSPQFYNSYECDCHNHPTLSVTGSSEALGEENCGRACGGLTACPFGEYEDCAECCEEYWCDRDESGLSSDNEVRGCMDSCVKTCSSKSMLVEIYEAIKLIVVIVAALMFALCGIFYLLSDTPESRDKAKGCMVYSIIGLVVVGLAIPLVELIYELTLPAGVGPGISCISVIGDAIADCYDKGMAGVKTFEYPCRNINVESCEGSVTKEDVEHYLDSIGRKDITGSTSPSTSKIVWRLDVISSELGDEVCIQVKRWTGHNNVDVIVIKKSDDVSCRSKEQIDLVGPLVRKCWNENDGSSVDVYCSSIDENVIASWPGDVRVTRHSIYSYLHFYGNGDASVDFKDGDVTNSYGDDACITFDTWAGDEVFVSKASVDTFCRLYVFRSYIDPIARAVLSCWNGRHSYSGDTKCNEIDVSGWPPFSEVTVTEDDVIKYLEKVLNEPGVPVNFKSGSISSDWGTDHVCITYDTRWFNEVFVSKTSDEPLCS